MSDAAFTDSTTPRLENCRTRAPFSGSSTNTTSPSCSCAKWVMPMVAVSPSRRTHSCSFESRRSCGTVMFVALASSALTPLIERRLHYRSRNVPLPNADRQRRTHLGRCCRNVRQRDVLLHRRPERAARHDTDDLAALRHGVAVSCHAPLDHQAGDAALRAFGLDLGDGVAAE